MSVDFMLHCNVLARCVEIWSGSPSNLQLNAHAAGTAAGPGGLKWCPLCLPPLLIYTWLDLHLLVPLDSLACAIAVEAF
jgi:hypothetical protein